MQPGDLTLLDAVTYVVVAIENDDVSVDTSNLKLLLLIVETANLVGVAHNPVECPSIDSTVDRAFLRSESCAKVTGLSRRVTNEELSALAKAVREFHSKRASINVVSLLMHIQHSLLPSLRDEFAAVESICEARKQAIDRLQQMDELLLFFVAIVESSPREALTILADRPMPKPSDPSDRQSIRWFFKSTNSLFVVSQLVEELMLYCRSRWIRSESEPLIEKSIPRLNVFWDLSWDTFDRPETMLLRLPFPLRKEICYLH